MIYNLLPNQNELHVLPVYSKLSTEQKLSIALSYGLVDYSLKEHKHFDMASRAPKFEHYCYVFKYKSIILKKK